jgi:ribonuclease-3
MYILKKTVDSIKVFFSFFTEKDSVSCNTQGVDEFESKIGYHFKKRELLIQSLTHKSGVSLDDRKGLFSNERLEFLGDSVLNCLVTEHLYFRYPDQAEGQLSKIKSLLVSRKIIGDVAKPLGLGTHLFMGNSEKKSGGAKRTSIISNAFEAILGAIYLDGGLEPARKVLERFLYERIDNFLEDERNVNYKSQILEAAQHDGFGIPSYIMVSEEGPDHEKRFIIAIEIAGVRLGEGSGTNKKIAEQNAAFNASRNYSREFIVSHKKGV